MLTPPRRLSIVRAVVLAVRQDSEVVTKYPRVAEHPLAALSQFRSGPLGQVPSSIEVKEDKKGDWRR